MTETLTQLLLRLSEVEPPALLWGRSAQPHFGTDFERLLDSRILIEERPCKEWPVCPSCECDLDMRPLIARNGQSIAACPLDHRNDETLEDDDLRIFRLDHRAFVQALVSHSSLSSPPSEIAVGIWSLGASRSGTEVFLVFQASVALRPESVDAIIRGARGRRRLLITPGLTTSARAPFHRAEIHVLALSDCLRPDPGRVVPTLDVEGFDAGFSKPRLIIRHADHTAFLDGHECRLAPRQFKLFHYLAAQASDGKALCDRRDIERHLWATPMSEKAVADAVRDLRKKIKPILNKDLTPETFIQSRPPTGYMLTLSAEDIRIDP